MEAMDSSRHSRRDMDSSRHSRKGESEFDSSSLLSLIEKAAENDGARKALHTRKKYELKLIRKFDKWRLTSKECWFLVDAKWLNAWSTFVKGPDDADPPGLISNSELLDEAGNPLPGLRSKIDYRGVAPIAYYVLVQLHGRDKSPTICRYTVDIYKPAVPDERLVNMKMTAVMEAKIQVNKARPKWMSWDIEFEEDEEDDGLGWCCGLTKEHIEAFIYWAIMCWSGRGRKKSGRENISYSQYKPLQNEEDDPEAPAIHSTDGTGNGNGTGNSSHSRTGSSHGNSSHGNSSHGNTSKHGTSSSSHGNNSNSNTETVNMLHSTQTTTNSSTNTSNSASSSARSIQPVTASREQFAQQRGAGAGGKVELVAVEMSDSEYESTDDEGFAMAPADRNHEKGTWLHSFMRS